MNENDLSVEQRYVLQKFKKGENIFVTGPGGTGKTHLIQFLLQYANKINKHIDVCAMTGCAALLLKCNATTLHSWSGIKLARGTKKHVIDNVLRNKNCISLWKRSNGLILDEVSMLSRKIFEIIEEIARIVKRSSKPFGGMQVIFTGDFFQLPPIGNEGEVETEEFCFESPLWYKVFKKENMIELKTFFRQTDPLYISILQQIRRGELDEENKRILQSYVSREYNPEEHNGCIPTKLFALRVKADYINNMMFSKLNEKEYVNEVEISTNTIMYADTTKEIDQETLEKCSKLTKQEIDHEVEHLMNNTPSSKVFRFKKGAVVMCIVNLDMEQSICNGLQGIIIDIVDANGHSPIKEPLPVVKFANGVIKTMTPYIWQSDSYPTISISQFPLCLAWGITIHKIQGTTLSMAEMDIGYSIFEYGQTYVALSRIKSLDGLYLTAFHPQKIKANPKVKAFYDSIESVDMEDINNEELDLSKYVYIEEKVDNIIVKKA